VRLPKVIRVANAGLDDGLSFLIDYRAHDMPGLRKQQILGAHATHRENDL
jgi:hypothetical protein